MYCRKKRMYIFNCPLFRKKRDSGASNVVTHCAQRNHKKLANPLGKEISYSSPREKVKEMKSYQDSPVPS